MTDIPTNRRMRNRLLIAVALFICLALLAGWQIATLREAPLDWLDVFILGGTLGAMTCVGLVVRHRWHLYLASRP
jgi:hypothetical protein